MTQFRISACSGNYGRLDLLQIMDRLAELGFDGVEVTTMYHAAPAETPSERRRQILRHAKDAGLQISGIHYLFAPGMSLTSNDEDTRKRTIAHALATLELAGDLEAPIAMVGAGFARSIPEGTEATLGRSRLITAFKEIAEAAAKLGVTVCFEALNRYETNVGRSLAECNDLVIEIASPSCCTGADTFHMNIEEVSLPKAIESDGHRLAHFHLADSHRLAPGGGHVDFRPILDALEAIKYGGFVSFEFFFIAPYLAHLPTFELCDAEVVKGIRHVRSLA